MKTARTTFLLVIVIASAGCASRRTNLIARTGGQPLQLAGHTVSLMASRLRNPEERELDRLLTLELQRRGLNLVPPADAEFTINANSEINWDKTSRTVQPQVIWNTVAYPQHPGMVTMPPASPDPPMVPLREEIQIQTEGIRMRVYETSAFKQGRFQAAWEGYIEAGLKLRPEQQPALLKTLCDYLGKDFIGHVKIPK